MKNILADPLLDLNEYSQLLEDLESDKKIINVSGIIEEGLGHFIYSLDYHQPGTKFIISYSEQRARRIYEDLRSLKGEKIYFFPKKREEFFETYRRSMEDVYDQIGAMYGLNQKNSIIVSSFEGLLDKIMDPSVFNKLIKSIDLSSNLDLEELNNSLVDGGYEKVSQVEAKGQFSIRGDIVDIYIPIYDNPVRIELFDIEVDSIRYFNINSQRSEGDLDVITIVPAREILIFQENKEKISKAIKKSLEQSHIKDDQVKEKLDYKFKKIIDKIQENSSLNNMSLIAPFMDQKNLASIVDYVDEDGLFIIDEPKRIENQVEDLKEDFSSSFDDLYNSGELLKEHKVINYSYEDIVEKISKHQKLTFTNILRENKYFKPQSLYNFTMKASSSYNSRMDIFKEEVERYLDMDYKVLILARGQERIKKLKKSLDQLQIQSELVRDQEGDLETNQVYLYDSSIGSGFEYPHIKFVILNHKEIYGEYKEPKRSRFKKEKNIDFANIKPGDYIVHENHGLGIYRGTEQVEIQDVKRDYLLIQYQGADRLYVPTDQLGMLYKYSGKEGEKRPKINKLDSLEWKKTKAKAQKSIDDMTDELIALYAKRENQRGFAFSEDSPWQAEFEDAFIYEDTQGQIESTREIKEDMEDPSPMDRLLCADVGYGKTEVALRAAFKAVMDNKQVAFLVPTTILAQQHYETMKERFKDFPVNISILSRFRTDSQVKEDLLKLELGELDIIVGTHRLLSKDVKFKDLGLVIIDEEQRFGVRHKESLKMLKENVDTLTLTATPIPRTLQMSMAGIRDMSVIEEPPEERFPVQTYVAEFNINMIKDAIERELDREGQVYFVYNRVYDIEDIAQRLAKIRPQAKIGIAHGQMNERQLENTFLDFMDHKIDILLTTTIIETGLDVQNANTLIVYNADRFGLAQLYQLRGRVGRSDRIAYAYFTFEDSTRLSEVAERRLMAIRDFTEFGSGYQIALRDLEIRGAGNILGSQQHGHINQIGYDLYMSLLEKSVKERKGIEDKDINETTIDLNIEAYIPKTYIKDEVQRLEFYKKISDIESEDDYYDLIEEGIDRYGDLPKPLINLIEISYIKALASKKSIESIKGDSYQVQISFKNPDHIDMENFGQIIEIYGDSIKFSPKRIDSFTYYPKEELLKDLKDFILQL